MGFIDDKSAERIGLNQVKGRLRPLSPYGRQMKQKMPVYLPGCEDQLRREWGLIKSLLEVWNRQLIDELELSFRALKDVRAIIRKASFLYVLEDVELFEVKRFLQIAAAVNQLLHKLGWAPSRLMPPENPELYETLAQGSSAGFYLAGSFAPQLEEYREQQRQLKTSLALLRQQAQEDVSSKTGRVFNHQGRLRVSKLESDLVRQLAGCPWLTFVAETYTEVEYSLRQSPEMIKFGREISTLEDKIIVLEHQVRAELSQEVAAQRRRLLAACRRLGRVDLILAKACLAREATWCVPEIVSGPRLCLQGFINPVVEQYLSKQGLSFQPLSLNLENSLVSVITGANMGGKSVSLKSAGLAVGMAQMGLLVPAAKFSLSLRSFIFYSQQDEDLQQGLSTFGAEIRALAKVLPRREQPGLYLLDEPARGTNPWEGNALVKAIALWLQRGQSITLIATHFHGLSELTDITKLRVSGLTPVAGLSRPDLTLIDGLDPEVGLEQLTTLMNYTLVPSTGEVPQDALKIAAFLGLDSEILAAAAQEMGLPPKRS